MSEEEAGAGRKAGMEGGCGGRMRGEDAGGGCDVWGATAVARGDAVPSRSPPVAGRRGQRFPNQTSPRRSLLTEYVSGYFGIFRSPSRGRQGGQITPLPWELRGGARGRRRRFVLVRVYFIELLFQNKRISGLVKADAQEGNLFVRLGF